MKKQKISVEVRRVSTYDLEGTLADVRNYIYSLLEQYGPTARLGYDRHGSDPYSDNPEYWVMIDRDETDEEFDSRVLQHNLHKKTEEARDRAELKRLQDKLGVK